MPKPRIDADTELRDTISRAVCSFGGSASDACEQVCIWCRENADVLIEIFRKYEGNHDQQQPNRLRRGAHRTHGR